MSILLTLLEGMTGIFLLLIGLFFAWILLLYIQDVTQVQHAVRRNYPVVGRFRYFFEHLGEFFRQYFFALDREELPFNRAERSWVYRSAKKVDSTLAFGSTRALNATGTVMFANCVFPTLSEDSVSPSSLVLGPYCVKPYETNSLFNISGMSFGAISSPAVTALSQGAHKAGCWMNTGEGGLSSHHLEGECDLIFQIGTAKYGVRKAEGGFNEDKLREVASHERVRMFELKMSQGAKPGKGGILPGGKVTPEIAHIRGIPQGQDSISPNGHPEIKSVDDLLDMINYIRKVTGKPTGFKVVIGHFEWVEDLFRAIHLRGVEQAPDFITLDSADGGTGAAPQSLMDYVGLPIHQSLPRLVDYLVRYDLRERIRVITSGKLVNPAEVAWALCAGADFTVSARGFMFALGCIQALQCNRNTCPTGITTHNPKLQRGLVVADKAERVANYVERMVYEVGVIAHSCGVRHARELRRHHAHVVSDTGLTVLLGEMFPEQTAEPALWGA